MHEDTFLLDVSHLNLLSRLHNEKRHFQGDHFVLPNFCLPFQ